MTSLEEEFCHWLNGVLDFKEENLTPEEVEKIKEKLQTVFNKQTTISLNSEEKTMLPSKHGRPRGFRNIPIC